MTTDTDAPRALVRRVAAGIALLLLTFGLPGLEALAQPQLDRLEATTTATTVRLDWTADTSGTDIVGYNIYRRPADGRYVDPVGHTGVRDADAGTRYTDTKLRSGQTYYYKVVGRTSRFSESGETQEIKVTTRPESAKDGTYTYANLKVAVVIYQNANHRDGSGAYTTPDRLVDDIKFFFDKAKAYYWRNSNMKLNLQFTYYPIEEYKNFGNAGSYQSVGITGQHLEDDYGVVNTQYDLVFRITPSIGGYWSFGATDGLDMDNGPRRRTGFSHLQWPMREWDPFTKYPGEFEGQVSKELNQLIWLFIHEAQHAIDGIYRYNGHREMGHGDFPERYTKGDDYTQLSDTLRFGKRYDFQSTLLRTFDPDDFSAYTDLDDDWGDVYRVQDQDGDGLPDQDSLVALDEARFGSSPQRADTDGDGYDDKAEATDGLYFYSPSDPNDADTDGDGVTDGNDRHPRYDVAARIPQVGGFRPAVDGDVSEWSERTQISQGSFYTTSGAEGLDPTVHAAYFRDSLYVALDVPASAVPTFRFDFGADGRWFGGGNTEVRADIANEGIERLRTYDARTAVRQYQQQNDLGKGGMWDSRQAYRKEFTPVFTSTNTRMAVTHEGGRVQMEMAFPRSERAGLTLEPGNRIGFRLFYDQVRGNDEAHATTFDKWSYVYFTLGDEKVEQGGRAEETALQGAYPNPFDGSGTLNVEYSAAERGNVKIAVYNALGRQVRTLKQGTTRRGSTIRVRWDGTNASGQPVASGVYFIRMTKPGGGYDTQQVVVVR